MSGFFDSLSGLDAQTALDRCEDYADTLREEIQALTEKLALTPRGDKQGAHALKHQIASLQATRKRLKPIISGYRSALEKRESHGLWASAVREFWGQDALRDVYDWMSAERKRRKALNAS
jgi:hypothetical protein